VPIKLLALDALGKTGDGALVAPISALADDPSPELRAKALRSLGELGYPDAPRARRRILARADAGGELRRAHRLPRRHTAPHRAPRR
jgi:HEAT repeat protein